MIACEAGVVDILSGNTVVHFVAYFMVNSSYILKGSLLFPAHQKNEQSSPYTIVYDIQI